MGSRASFALHVGATGTNVLQEPHQPGNQDAHNRGAGRSLFGNLRYHLDAADTITLTLSHNPDTLQVGNRTGLPAQFAVAGQGYGFLGMRNADGTRPDVTPENQNALGAGTILLPSQQAAHQDIDENEVSEFATLNLQHRFGAKTSGQIAFSLLHSGEDLHNHNPVVNPFNLPIDNSIEFNPTAIRDMHHVQFSGSVSSDQRHHKLKAGFLFDSQSGHEAYTIVPASQLALDALAAAAPNLCGVGTISDELDVNGNHVFTLTGPIPTLRVHRTGYYGAAYVQDTLTAHRFTANYGLRADWYHGTQNLGQSPVSQFELCPRVNLAYKADSKTEFRASYNKLLNTPPLAQGAVIGAPIRPETLSQYDLGVTRALGGGQSFGAAYYYKDIRNQVDTGLLIPGSEIGLYSSVNLDKGGVHGLELSYNVAARKGVGWDGFLNYTLSAAKPKGFDNTGAEVEPFNDHDQRHTVGAGLAYTWANGMSTALTFQYGSGLASSIVPPNEGRTSRHQFDFRFSSPPVLFGKTTALTLDIENLTDQRTVINFQSAFSGTRFMIGRRILVGLSSKW